MDDMEVLGYSFTDIDDAIRIMTVAERRRGRHTRIIRDKVVSSDLFRNAEGIKQHGAC